MKCRRCGNIVEHEVNSVGGFDHPCRKCGERNTGLVKGNSCQICSEYQRHVSST